ncbi:MAG: molybdenum cofactor biosynthesis protein MoaE [Sphingomonadaceae bacterium]
MRLVRIEEQAFNPGDALTPFIQAHPLAGGITTFVGKVRGDEAVSQLELTHYPPLTLPGMESLADAAFARFTLMGLLLIHRVGIMQPGDPIVCVSAAARHRRDGLQAVDYCMDHLKASAWFWKRELRDGAWHWIEPRAEDYHDLARWR